MTFQQHGESSCNTELIVSNLGHLQAILNSLCIMRLPFYRYDLMELENIK